MYKYRLTCFKYDQWGPLKPEYSRIIVHFPNIFSWVIIRLMYHVSCADFTSATVQERPKVTRVVVLGGGAGSRIIRLPRLLDEGPMGKPVAHPERGLLYSCHWQPCKSIDWCGWVGENNERKINMGKITWRREALARKRGSRENHWQL